MKIELIYDAHRRVAVECLAEARSKPMFRLHHGNPAIAGLTGPPPIGRCTKANAKIQRWQFLRAFPAISLTSQQLTLEETAGRRFTRRHRLTRR